MPKRIGYDKSRPRLLTKIKQWREFREMSQEELGEKLGTSGSMISRIENGDSPYTQDTLEGIAVILKTDPVSLLMRNPGDTDGIWAAILAEIGKPKQ